MYALVYKDSHLYQWMYWDKKIFMLQGWTNEHICVDF